jgi:hypothetical protein
MSPQSDAICVRNMSLMAGGFVALLLSLIAVVSVVV